MDIAEARKVGRTFLVSLDEFLAANYQRLKCREICDIYYQFWHDLKDFRGTATGFTGLSEFLIFRFLYHQLGGGFERKDISRDLSEFVRREIRMGQGIPVQLGETKRTRPDIVLYHEERLVAVVQIKLFVTGGLKEIEREMRTLKGLKQANPNNFRALLVIYSHRPPEGKVPLELRKHKDTNTWFDYVILEDNEELLQQRLSSALSLDRLGLYRPDSHSGP
jgi:hypothetical protein